MKITRRKLAALAVAPAVALAPAAATAQTPPAEDLEALVKSQLRSNSEVLARFPVPLATEPAFVFKA